MDKRHCVGCKDNFYNGNNDYGIAECWLLKSAKVISRFRIDMDHRMDRVANYEPVRRPNCFDGGRYSGDHFLYLDEIPSYAK